MCVNSPGELHTAFHRSDIFDYDDVLTWTENGATTASQRAYTEVRELLASYKAPTLDPEIEKMLEEFIAKRKKEIRG